MVRGATQLGKQSEADVQLIRHGFEIELVGDIANMVAAASNLMTDKKTAPERAAVLDRFRSSVKVIAGARSQRFLPLSEVWL